MRLLSLPDYLADERPALDFLVPSLIPSQGAIGLVGPPKAGKSYLAVQLANAVALGGLFMNKRCKKGPVLYWYVDSDEPLFHARLLSLKNEHDLIFSNHLHFPHPHDLPYPFDVMTTGCSKLLKEAIKQVEPVLVVIDVLAKCHRLKENEETSFKLLFNTFAPIFAGRAVLYLHHTHKFKVDEEPSPSQAGRGSSFMPGELSANWLLTKKTLSIESRFSEDLQLKVHRQEDGLFAFPDLDKESILVAQLVSLCHDHPDLPHSKLAILAKQQWGIGRSNYYRLLAGVTCAHAVLPTPRHPIQPFRLAPQGDSPALPADASPSQGDTTPPVSE